MPMLIMEDLDNFPNKSMPSDFSDHDSDKRIYVSASQDCRKICYAEPDMKSSVDLHPLHLKDLRKSGLSDETIEVAGFKSVPPNDIKRKLGFDVSGLVSTYEIPYDKTFSRFRCFYMQGQNGRPKLPKYLQKKVAGNRLYIPGGARAVLNDPSVPLYIAEGEKKALKASQEGLVCIAISGLWNWSKGNKELIPDFDKITMKSRDVYIVPDNDYLHPNKHGYGKNLAQAVHELAHKLKERGARVFIIELPQGDAKGLDDYLCTHTVEEFQALPITEVLDLRERVKAATKGNYKDLMSEIADEKDPIEREMLCKDLASVLDVSLRIIKEAVNKLTISKYQSPEPNGNVIIFHPAYHVEDNLLLLGFRETVVIENKPEDRNFYLLAHPESYTLHTGNVIARGERNIVVDERDRFLLRAEDRWPKDKDYAIS